MYEGKPEGGQCAQFFCVCVLLVGWRVHHRSGPSLTTFSPYHRIAADCMGQTHFFFCMSPMLRREIYS